MYVYGMCSRPSSAYIDPHAARSLHENGPQFGSAVEPKVNRGRVVFLQNPGAKKGASRTPLLHLMAKQVEEAGLAGGAGGTSQTLFRKTTKTGPWRFAFWT